MVWTSPVIDVGSGRAITVDSARDDGDEQVAWNCRVEVEGIVGNALVDVSG